MNAEPFTGDAEHPIVIDKADDGTPLPDCRGWYCDACGTIYVEKDAAELCCMEPDAVRETQPRPVSGSASLRGPTAT